MQIIIEKQIDNREIDNNRKIEHEKALKEDGSGIGYLMGIEWLRIRIKEGKKN